MKEKTPFTNQIKANIFHSIKSKSKGYCDGFGYSDKFINLVEENFHKNFLPNIREFYDNEENKMTFKEAIALGKKAENKFLEILRNDFGFEHEEAIKIKEVTKDYLNFYKFELMDEKIKRYFTQK